MKELKGHQVAVLCGGRGTRLRPKTDTIPKALVELNGKPILDYIVEFYASKGLGDFILCVGYKGNLVKEHCRGYDQDLKFRFSDAGEDASMLQRIWEMRNLVDGRIFVSYCDTFIDLDIVQMLEEHCRKSAGITMVTAKIKNPFGLLTYDDNGWVNSFVEKPILNYYIGSFILEVSTLEYVTEEMLAKPDGGGIVDFFKRLTQLNLLAAYEHKGAQITFNTENERQKAEEILGHYYTISEDS